MRKGYGYTFTDGSPVPRYYDAIKGGWVRLRGPALLHNGRKSRAVVRAIWNKTIQGESWT